jgi:hypothetical protein
MRVTVQQAAQTALQVYLQPLFDAYFLGPALSGDPAERCVVSDRWPEPDSGLPRRAVSIIEAGAREDTYLQGDDIAMVAQPDGKTGLYTFRAKACRQPIQLDVWSNYNVQRDEVLALLDDYLNRGERFTLGIPNGCPTRDGVLLPLDAASGHTGFADFTFDGPKTLDTSTGARVREYRSAISGFIDVDLTVQALTPILARVLIKMALSSDSLAAPDLIFTLTPKNGEFVAAGTS